MNLEYPINEQFRYKKIELYQTKQVIFVQFPFSIAILIIKIVLLFDRTFTNHPDNRIQEIQLSEILSENDQEFNTLQEAKANIKEKNEQQKDPIYHGTCYGIVGFYKFLEGYYMLYIKEIIKVGRIGRHKIWQIVKTDKLNLFQSPYSKEEDDYIKILINYDLSQCFYLSCTYDLTNSLCYNVLKNSKIIPKEQKGSNEQKEDNIYRQYSTQPNIEQFCELFMWNYQANYEFNKAISNKKWIQPIIHGYFEQKRFKSLTQSFSISIISRRCRHHAGTRFLKRGMNEEGFAANFVETEQIVIDIDASFKKPCCTSFIQVRGSVPLFWFQNPQIQTIKPPITSNSQDHYYSATKKNFGDLFARYGEKIYCMDLVKSIETATKEDQLAQWYYNAINQINDDITKRNEITYFHFDIKKQLKADKNEYVEKCYSFAYHLASQIGIFQVCDSQKQYNQHQYLEFQNGVLRTNCVDCLDRTNSFQQLVGELIMMVQLAKMYKQKLKFGELEISNQVLNEFRGMFEMMGDHISCQYGSTKAHKQGIEEQKGQGKISEFITSVKRHYNNNFKDKDRQKNIDVFLGNFRQIYEVSKIQFFPKNGQENIVFRQDDKNQVDDQSWWKWSIEAYKTQNYIKYMNQNGFKQNTSPYQFKFQARKGNLNLQFVKKYQNEFINMIKNPIDKNQVYFIYFNIAIPSNYFEKNQWISQGIKKMDEQSTKMNENFEKEIELDGYKKCLEFKEELIQQIQQPENLNQSKIQNNSTVKEKKESIQCQTNDQSKDIENSSFLYQKNICQLSSNEDLLIRNYSHLYQNYQEFVQQYNVGNSDLSQQINEKIQIEQEINSYLSRFENYSYYQSIYFNKEDKINNSLHIGDMNENNIYIQQQNKITCQKNDKISIDINENTTKNGQKDIEKQKMDFLHMIVKQNFIFSSKTKIEKV